MLYCLSSEACINVPYPLRLIFKVFPSLPRLSQQGEMEGRESILHHHLPSLL